VKASSSEEVKEVVIRGAVPTPMGVGLRRELVVLGRLPVEESVAERRVLEEESEEDWARMVGGRREKRVRVWKRERIVVVGRSRQLRRRVDEIWVDRGGEFRSK